MDAFRVNAMTGFISLDLMFQIGTFVEGVPADSVDASQTATGEADAGFSTKFNGLVHFAADDRTHMGAMKADDAVITM